MRSDGSDRKTEVEAAAMAVCSDVGVLFLQRQLVQ